MRASARMLPGTLRSDVSVRGGRFRLVTDEPESAGGENTALAPHELLPGRARLVRRARRSPCMRGRRSGSSATSRSTSNYDHRSTPRRFEVEIRLGGELSEEQLQRLEKVAASCPVRRSIESGVVFEERIATPRAPTL